MQQSEDIEEVVWVDPEVESAAMQLCGCAAELDLILDELEKAKSVSQETLSSEFSV